MKKIKLILFLLFGILLWQDIYSQSNTQSECEEWKSSQDEYVDFDISKYFTPDIVRNQLSINFDLNSSYSHQSGDYAWLNLYNEMINDSSVLKIYNFAGKIASNFSQYINTRRKISDLRIELSLNDNYTSKKTSQTINISSDKDNIYSRHYSSDNNNVYSGNYSAVSWSNKWYFSKSFYLNYRIYNFVAYDFTQEKMKNQSEEGSHKRNEFELNFSPGLGIGYGRLEDVTDARQAVYIANALSKRNILTRNLSNEELFELSQQISTVKNKRFLDSRLHLIDEISTVDSFFVKNELLNNTGAAYFTTLYDLWQYGTLFPRKSGYEISFLAYPYYTYNHSKNTPELQTGAVHDSHQAFCEAGLIFNYEKPFKLNWQHSVEAGSAAFLRQGKAREIDFNSLFSTTNKMFSAWALYSLGYYPNTRTNIQATALQQMRKQINKVDRVDADIYNEYWTEYATRFSVSMNYYLSPYFRIAGNFSLNYGHYFSNNSIPEYSTHSKNNNFNTIFNIQFIYSFF